MHRFCRKFFAFLDTHGSKVVRLSLISYYLKASNIAKVVYVRLVRTQVLGDLLPTDSVRWGQSLDGSVFARDRKSVMSETFLNLLRLCLALFCMPWARHCAVRSTRLTLCDIMAIIGRFERWYGFAIRSRTTDINCCVREYLRQWRGREKCKEK